MLMLISMSLNIWQWFGFYRSGQANEVYTLNESDLFKQASVGLCGSEYELLLYRID